MNETTTPTPEEPRKKRPSVLRRTLAFLFTLALVLGAIALVVFREELNIDAVKRYISYRSLERSDTGQTQAFRHDSGSSAYFTDLGNDLLLCSSGGVEIFSESGVNYLTDPVVLNTPMMQASSTQAVVYDAGGTTLRVYGDRNNLFSTVNTTGYEILSAHISEQGILAVTSQAPGYKGMVTLYDTDFNPTLSLRISSRFVMDGLIADDGKTIAVLTMGQTNNTFDSALALYDVDGDAPFATTSLGSGVVLDLVWNDGAFWALGEDCLTIVQPSGEISGQYDYSNQYLKAFSSGGNGFSTLLVGPYRAGSNATLVTVDDQGEPLASLDLSEQVLSLDATSRYVSVLTASGLRIYTKDLSLYASLDTTAGIRDVVLRDDGTAYLLSGEEVQLFIPNSF